MIIESHRDERGIRTISLNRPPANAINVDMMHAVRDAFDGATADWDTKVVILDSTNPRYFCAGWDIKQPASAMEGLPPETPQYGSYMGREVFRAIKQCGVPVIAKVRGVAVGAGFLYASLADFVVASDTAKFGQFEIKVGAVGGAGMLRNLMTEQAMRYFTWTGHLADAAELVAMGAGIRLVADDALDAEVEKLAVLLASRDTQLIRQTKFAMNQVEEIGALEAYAIEQMHTSAVSQHKQRQQASKSE